MYQAICFSQNVSELECAAIVCVQMALIDECLEIFFLNLLLFLLFCLLLLPQLSVLLYFRLFFKWPNIHIYLYIHNCKVM